MKTLGIILTLAAVCVIQTLSATSAPDITVNLNMTFSGTWDPIYSNMSHENTTGPKTAIETAVVNNATKVKTCRVKSFSAGSIVADMTLTAAGTENSTSVRANVDSAKDAIAASVSSAGFNIGTITGIVDTTSGVTTTTTSTTASPGSAASTLSTSVIMYLIVLYAMAKVVLF